MRRATDPAWLISHHNHKRHFHTLTVANLNFWTLRQLQDSKMGNDGGRYALKPFDLCHAVANLCTCSIPTRRELVKEAARDLTTTQVKETQQEQQEYHWTTCPLSHRPLAQPVVSDLPGKLYNKDAVLEYLLPAGDGTPGLSKSDNEQVLEGRVRSLRDVVEVKFEVEKEVKMEKNGRASPKGEKWICPITSKALGPGVKAVYLVPCGHAFSEGAIKEISSQNCLQVSGHFMLGINGALVNRFRHSATNPTHLTMSFQYYQLHQRTYNG